MTEIFSSFFLAGRSLASLPLRNVSNSENWDWSQVEFVDLRKLKKVKLEMNISLASFLVWGWRILLILFSNNLFIKPRYKNDNDLLISWSDKLYKFWYDYFEKSQANQ